MLGSLARFIEAGMVAVDVDDRVVVVPPGEASRR